MERDLSEKERALRVELAKRTVNIHRSDDSERVMSDDSAYAKEVGREISRLIHEERLEHARQRLREELSEHPHELMFISLQMIVEFLDRKFGDYSEAKKYGTRLMEEAVEKNNSYYAMVALTNMGLVAHSEGLAEHSKTMYLAAHFINCRDVTPMRNLAGWYARRNRLEEAQRWIDKLLDTYPDWHEREEITTFLLKDESLRNLRAYAPYQDRVMSKLKENQS